MDTAIDACDSHDRAAGICRTGPPSHALLVGWLTTATRTFLPESTGTNCGLGGNVDYTKGYDGRATERIRLVLGLPHVILAPKCEAGVWVALITT